MEPFFDCGLFELIFAAIALMACLNFVYRRMVMLIFFTLLSIGCSIYAVIAANGNLKTAIAILGFTALLALNFWIWRRRMNYTGELLFNTVHLKERVITFFRIKSETK